MRVLTTPREAIVPSHSDPHGGLAPTAAVAGYDPETRSWVTGGARPYDRVPPLDGTLLLDLPSRRARSRDLGMIAECLPGAVLEPGSVHDVQAMIRFCGRHGIGVATRGQGHSMHGQGLVPGLLVDSAALRRIHRITPTAADVDAGVTWRELTVATCRRGLTPPLLTDYIGLSVGGTLSVGGVGQANHLGAQVDHARALEVVTGDGELHRCTPDRDHELFEAALGGLGQCGVITRATVDLVPARRLARTYELTYTDNPTFFRDFRMLARRGEFGGLYNTWVPDGTGIACRLNAVAFFDPTSPPDDRHLLRDVRGVAARDDDTYLDWAQHVDIGVQELRALVDWDHLVKPWYDVWLPEAAVEEYVGGVLGELGAPDLGPTGLGLLHALRRQPLTRPFLRVPDGEWVYLFSILTASALPGPDPAFAAAMLARNRRWYDRARAVGGTWYPNGALEFTAADWRAQYGALWPELHRRKRRYDPDGILTPGPGIF